MLAVLSPSKNLDFKSPKTSRKRSEPVFVDDTELLVGQLKELKAKDIQNLMNISDDLSEVNRQRYQTWTRDFKQAKQAILAFKGDTYWGLEAWDFSERELTSAQRRLRILSGLYGLLKPLDLIHPYRLEMGLAFENSRAANLYGFWGDKITEKLNEELSTQTRPMLINLASHEYFSSISKEKLNYPVVQCQFLDKFRDDYRFMSYYGKRARGMLARHIVVNKVDTLKGLRAFNYANYEYNADRSTKYRLVFTRDEPPPRP